MKWKISFFASTLVLCFFSTGYTVPISGIYTGTFIDPVPSSPPAVTTGIGTNSITWGIPCDGVTNCVTSPGGITPPSSFLFTARLFVTEIGAPFVLGEILFFNGTVFPGTQIDQITLFLDGFQITPTQFAGPDTRLITIANTPNTGDPIASADRATIPMAFFPAANSFGVLESESATATLLGAFRETTPEMLALDILGFGEVTSGAGFVEGFAPHAVPEPGTWLLLSTGLCVLFGCTWWRRDVCRGDCRGRCHGGRFYAPQAVCCSRHAGIGVKAGQ